jgi:dihydroorotate dehydrogenase (fumarate)
MINLTTNYLGLELKNPLVPSASPLSKSLDTAKLLEDAGAAALVMYSLFEEELLTEDAMMERFLVHGALGHNEANSYLPDDGTFRSGLDRYLEQIQRLKTHLDIPVVASLNGVSLSGWVKLGQELQQAGADALELNVYHIAADPEQSGDAVEDRYVELLKMLHSVVRIPVVMKLSPFFSALPNFVKRLEGAGASGVALFNRFYQPDIDIDQLRVQDKLQLSTPDEVLLRLRWIAILRDQTPLTLAATGGVYTAGDLIKLLLAGADVVHLASSLLLHGPGRLREILAGLQVWLEENEYESVRQMKGSMSLGRLRDPSAMVRESYVWVLNGYTPPSGVEF